MKGSDNSLPIILDMGKYGKHVCKSFRDAKQVIRTYIVAPRIFAYDPKNNRIFNETDVIRLLMNNDVVYLYPSRFSKERLLGVIYNPSKKYKINL